MGFWGSFVVCRSEAPLDGLSAVIERHDGMQEHWRRAGGRAGGWQVGQYSGPDLADDASALVAELAGETGAPALTGFVLDSDAVHVEGFSVAGGHWKACLVREATEAYCEDDDEDFDAEFPSAEAAAHTAAAWASEAGRTPDLPGLVEVFAQEDSDLAEELLFRLLDELGV
ncbi:hypothetical protein [Streptomyces sp. NBC_00038]|uniref:hypothetical protein n=1 Tax=Streptomyces sp. NBC_00038 TaxID=2903615 RepID=UPI002252ECBE|nr:hypothetical protein [Streptomyces sp. NBC_00038]MCX5557280.1 hypothetical protein [Streptomyces sp. NBC_00038]